MARSENTPNDPDRRERIVTATVCVLQDAGVAAVTARAVAARAGVPVGSVSYHFDSVRALLLEASRRVLRLRARSLAEWSRKVTAATVVERLAELTHHQLTDERAITVIAYELYILGLRDEEFAALSTSSIRKLREHLTPFCSPLEAARLAAAADGLQLQSLFQSAAPSREDIAAILRSTSED